MTLLLVVSGGATSSRLTDRLSTLGFSVAQSELPRARDRMLRDPPELVLCDPDVAAQLAEAVPGVPLVIVTDDGVDKETLLALLRVGAVELLDVGDTDPELVAIVEGALDRTRHRATFSGGPDHDGSAVEVKLRELERDQRAGRYVQMGMLPPSPMAVDDYRLRHRIFPSLMLSGDFVDYFRIGEQHFAFYVADVAGHGASSAFVTVLLKNFSRRLRREFRPQMLTAPGEILAWLNRELLGNRIGKHVAIFLGVVDGKRNRLTFANGGHFPPAMLADVSGARALDMAGKPVGLFRDATWESRAEQLADRFCLCLVSDGVLEVMDKAPLAERERRLVEATRQCFEEGREIWNVLDLEARQPGPDDMACVMVTRGLG
jgi:sigma-B regulation protein RsbU (phosphoserine phosphatase)